MPRARKKAIAAPATAQAPTPADAAVPAVVETPPAPVPVEEEAGAALRRATGTDNPSLQAALLTDLVGVLGVPSGSSAYTSRGGAAIALASGLAPRDAVEGALGVQFAALHAAGMAALKQAANPALPAEVGSRLRRDAANLFRAAVEMVEAVEARRGNGARQRIVVEHVDKAIFTGPQAGGPRD